MEPPALLQGCIRLLQTYNPSVSSLDSHIHDSLGDFAEDPDKTFMQQVFYGVSRMKKMLKIFVNALYHKHGTTLTRADHTLYEVLAYIVMFRLDELSMRKLRALIADQDPARMQIVLSFLFDLDGLRSWCLEEWRKVLDRTFIEKDIFGRLERHMPEMQAFLHENRERAFGAAGAGGAAAGGGAAGLKDGPEDSPPPGKARKSSKPPTVPVPPKITKPRPRVIPEPIRIEQKVEAHPVPPTLDAVTLAKLEEERRARTARVKAETTAKYADAKAPALHETRNTVDAVRAEIEAVRASELRFDGVRAKSPPALPKEGADVRLNVAAVLREDFLLRQRQAKEAALIAGFESELRDASEFHRWQEEMKGLDEKARLAAVESRRQEMAAAARLAAEAVERERAEKRAIAEELRRERELIEKQRELERRAEIEASRAVVEEIREVRATAPKEVRRVLEDARRREAEALKRVEEERAEAIARAREAEQLEREDRIRQIRALERVPKVRVKTFDPTEHSNMGLMDEMSMLEARERLAIQKAREREEEEEKRQELRRKRLEAQEALRERLEGIARLRGTAATMNRITREEAKLEDAVEAEVAASRRSTSQVILAAKLAEKRAAREAERRALEEESAKIAKKNMFLGAAKSAMEEKRFDQLLSNAEAATMLRQASVKREQDVADDVKREEELSRARLRRAASAAMAARRKAQAETVEERHRETERFHADDRVAKKEMFFREAAREERLKLAVEESNLYATTISSKLADDARARRGGVPRDTMHAEVIRKRMERLNEDQLRSTGMLATVESAAALDAVLRHKMDATKRASEEVTMRLSKGLGAARARASSPSKPVRVTDSMALSSARAPAGATVSPTRDSPVHPSGLGPRRRSESALAASQAILFASTMEMDEWSALAR